MMQHLEKSSCAAGSGKAKYVRGDPRIIAGLHVSAFEKLKPDS
jgi:hypothetical protein